MFFVLPSGVIKNDYEVDKTQLACVAFAGYESGSLVSFNIRLTSWLSC